VLCCLGAAWGGISILNNFMNISCYAKFISTKSDIHVMNNNQVTNVYLVVSWS